MTSIIADTYWVKIYISGPTDVIEQTCRAYCKKVGLCVTVAPTKFIYTGGEETGVEVGLANYPRFPVEDFGILDEHAVGLGMELLEATHQNSFMVMTPVTTCWYSNRTD